MSTPEDDDPPRRTVGSRLTDRLFDRARRATPGHRRTHRTRDESPASPIEPPPPPASSSRATPASPARGPAPPLDRRPPRVPHPVSSDSSGGRPRLTPATGSSSSTRHPNGIPKRTIDDYMQMLGELRVAEARYRRSLDDPRLQVHRPRADEEEEGG